MSYRPIDLAEAADYLHLTVDEMKQLMRDHSVPHDYQGDKLVFDQEALHDWHSRRIIGATQRELGDYVRAASKQRPPPDRHEAFLSQFALAEGINANCQAKTRPSLLRELVKAASATNLVCDDKLLLRLIEEREELCSTGIDKGVAIPHPRIHPDYLFMDTFLVILIVPGGVPFGAPDGQYTDLFFMPCSPDERTHLYILARIARLLHVTKLADALRECVDGEEVIVTLHNFETEFIEAIIP